LRTGIEIENGYIEIKDKDRRVGIKGSRIEIKIEIKDGYLDQG
jgi:hypothetical protein